jgi:hypothetical protein
LQGAVKNESVKERIDAIVHQLENISITLKSCLLVELGELRHRFELLAETYRASCQSDFYAAGFLPLIFPVL